MSRGHPPAQTTQVNTGVLAPNDSQNIITKQNGEDVLCLGHAQLIRNRDIHLLEALLLHLRIHIVIHASADDIGHALSQFQGTEKRGKVESTNDLPLGGKRQIERGVRASGVF